MSRRPAIPARIGRLLPLLGSDKPGEVENACRAISRDLGAVGLDWHGVEIVAKVVGDVETSSAQSSAASASAPMPQFFEMARACRDHYGDRLDDWEAGFVADMCRRTSPTPNQTSRLSSIFARVRRRAA